MEANQFFQSLFGNHLNQNGGFVELRQVEPSIKQEFCNSVDEVLNHLDAFKVNWYFGVSPRKDRVGTKAGVSHVVTLWADVDFGQDGHKGKVKFETYDQALSAINQFEVKPSIIVSTGHGFQLYWLLNQPEAITDASTLLRVEGILKAIAIAIGGDLVHDISRILRIPGTINQKADKEGNKLEAKNVEIIGFEPTLRYSLEDFNKFRSETKLEFNNPEVSFSDNIEKVDIETLEISSRIREFIKLGDTQKVYPSRSECDQVVITALVSKGYGPDVIKAIFTDENNKIGEKYRTERINKGDAYLKASIEKALNFLQSKAEANSSDSVPTFPLEAFPTTGFLGEYVQYASPCTDAPVQFHIATALSVLSIIVNRKVFVNRGSAKLFPVLWVLVLAESGAYRKSTTQKMGLDLLSEIKDKDEIPGNLVGSNEFSKEGLIKDLSVSPRKILCFNEFSSLLTQAEASYNKGLKPILIDLFDTPPKYSRKLKEEIFNIDEPFLNILGASTTEWFIGNIKEEELRSGFLARFIYICAMKKQRSLPFPPPADSKLRKQLIKTLTKLNKKRGEMELSAEAMQLYVDWYVKYEGKLEKESLKGLLAPFYVRLTDYLLKITLLFAVNDEVLVISEAHMKQGITLIDYLTDNLRHYLTNEMSCSPFAKEKKKIKRMVLDSGFQGISYSKLLRNSNKDTKILGVYLTTLIESGEIYERPGPKNGKFYVSTQFKRP